MLSQSRKKSPGWIYVLWPVSTGFPQYWRNDKTSRQFKSNFVHLIGGKSVNSGHYADFNGHKCPYKENGCALLSLSPGFNSPENAGW